MDVVFLSESRRAEMFTPASLLVLHYLGLVVERGWRWLRAIPPLAGRVSGLCDVEHGTGRRALTCRVAAGHACQATEDNN